MDEHSTPNDHHNGRIYVKFGPHPTDEMPIEWAEKMFTIWKERQPNQFGKLLAEVITSPR